MSYSNTSAPDDDTRTLPPCKAARAQLQSASPADATDTWIASWQLLRKVRQSASVASALGLGAAAMLGFLIWRIYGEETLQNVKGYIVVGIAPISLAAYHMVVRMRLQQPIDIPPSTALPGILSAMTPFDGVAKEYLRRQGTPS